MAEDEKPATAGIYDYMLGGDNHTARDRIAGDQLNSVAPFRAMARLNRLFLEKSVRFLVDAGIRQFLDVGSGIPSKVNVHEVAQASAPDTRVVYVDYDPIAVERTRNKLVGNPLATAINGDLREPDSIINSPEARQLLDFEQPLGLLFLGVIQFISDDDQPAEVLTRFLAHVAPGSYLAMTHFTQDNLEQPMADAVEFFRSVNTFMVPRRHAEVAGLVRGLEPVPPGVVFTACWRPEPGEAAAYDNVNLDQLGHYAVIARKPGQRPEKRQ